MSFDPRALRSALSGVEWLPQGCGEAAARGRCVAEGFKDASESRVSFESSALRCGVSGGLVKEGASCTFVYRGAASAFRLRCVCFVFALRLRCVCVFLFP